MDDYEIDSRSKTHFYIKREAVSFETTKSSIFFILISTKTMRFCDVIAHSLFGKSLGNNIQLRL